ncbi:MAG: TetR/AcrR family transcriptional regulator, partial [Deltaproteobacteria bacterium]|nr:TetR/AcrR family transcriptional regulator [Deltaproteobacteria bacterium]
GKVLGETRKRDAILAVASRLFAEKGYGDTPTSEIAREAGVAEGTLYHHFGSKDGIFLTIFNETTDGYLAGIESLAGEGKTGAETLHDLIRFHYGYLGAHARQFLIILRDFPEHIAREKSDGGSVRKKKFGRITTLLAEILERGVKDGTLRLRFPARDTAEMMRAILYGTTRHRMLGIIDVPLPRLATMIEDFFLRTLSPERGPDEK